MELQTLGATVRENAGKGAASRVRADGAVPAVLYGGDKIPVNIQLNSREFEYLLHHHRGSQAVVQLNIGDKPDLSGPALLKAVQHHPVKGQAIHADFLRIRLDERITTTVPITIKGQARGLMDGGVLDHQLREVEVECLALEVPEELAIDVTPLGIGDSFHVSDLAAPAGVDILTDPERPIAAVFLPRVAKTAEEEAAEAAAATTEPATPEVIGRKKEKEEEEE